MRIRAGPDAATPLCCVRRSSWEAFGPGHEHPIRDYCDKNSLMAAADAFFQTGLYDAGYRHLHLDDCWSIKERNSTGFIQPDPHRFPPTKPGGSDGLVPVIEYLHGRNLTFGLYTDAGTAACMPTRSGSYGHWEQDAASFAEWGVRPPCPSRGLLYCEFILKWPLFQ